MRLFSLLLFVLAGLMACETADKQEMKFPTIPVDYPDTRKVDTVDNYFGTKVPDPYRWLEVDTAKAVENWVKRQNEVTFDYLEEIPYRDAIRSRYKELYDYPKLSSPIKAGDYYFFYKNSGLQNQPVIYIQKGLDGEPEVFLDPNEWAEDGTTALNIVSTSHDNKYVVVGIQEDGSDWREFKVYEIATQKELDDHLKWIKFSGASWYKDGFYYSRYPKPEEGTKMTGTNKFHQVYYHKLGQDQSEDRLVHRDENPRMYHSTSVTEDQNYLIMYKATGTDGFETYYKNLNKPDSEFRALFTGFTNKNSVIHHGDGAFLVRTDFNAPNYRLVSVPVDDPDTTNWEDVLPEQDYLLENTSTGGGKLFATYMKDAANIVKRYDLDGTNEQEIELPGRGSVSGFGGKEEDRFFFYTYRSFVNPSTIYKYDIETGESEIFHETELKFDPDDYVENEVFYKSKDGTKVHMFIVHKKGLSLDGDNPCYLYGYGGFNISLTPNFSTSRMMLLENGGVYAMPNLRGGGEYGEEWHEAGMLENKQNVFDDFIAAAEYLIDTGYTNKNKLAIAGGSNGGLLVGACMTQRPDLFAVAQPAVGVMDMLRYHKFTIGWGWVPEYGSSDDSTQFEYLYDYSPLHNIEDGTAYPATLATTADHDDRVVPAHSFKFIARLQEAHDGKDPVLIRIETSAGHGSGKPTSKILDEQADIWSFIFYNTETPVKYEVNAPDTTSQ